VRPGALLLLFVAACAGDEAQRCLFFACDPVVRFEINALPVMSRLAGATVEVCFNGACSEQKIYEVPMPADVTSVAVMEDLDPAIDVSLSRLDAGSPIDVTVGVYWGEIGVLKDGDVYRVVVVAADGSVIVDRSWSATYGTVEPDGPACEMCVTVASMTEL
jgi:hypothetical protein